MGIRCVHWPTRLLTSFLSVLGVIAPLLACRNLDLSILTDFIFSLSTNATLRSTLLFHSIKPFLNPSFSSYHFSFLVLKCHAIKVQIRIPPLFVIPCRPALGILFCLTRVPLHYSYLALPQEEQCHLVYFGLPEWFQPWRASRRVRIGAERPSCSPPSLAPSSDAGLFSLLGSAQGRSSLGSASCLPPQASRGLG